MPKNTHSPVSSGTETSIANARGTDEIIHRIDRQRAQGVDLLGDFHRADLRRHGRAHPAREHQAREHRAEFPAHRHGHQRPGGRLHAQRVELEENLRGEHRAGERSRKMTTTGCEREPSSTIWRATNPQRTGEMNSARAVSAASSATPPR